MTTPKIEPINIKDYTVKQSKYEIVPKLPTRQIVLGPSGSGKTVYLVSLILDVYKDLFARIYIFSPSISVDSSWLPVKKYIEDHMKVVHTEEERIYFDHYDPKALHEILDTQHKIIDYMKKQNYKKLHQIMIIIDDFADEPSFVHSSKSKLLNSLYVRGRHNMISVVTSVQKYTSLYPLIRVNATDLVIFRLRNMKD